MLNNISVTDDNIYYLKNRQRNGAKVAKLSTFNNVKNNTDKLKAEYKAANETSVTQAVSSEPQITSSAPVEVKTPETTAELPLTSEEVLKAKQDILGITAYIELPGNVLPFESIQAKSRRLKTNPVVPGNVNRERNVNGIDMTFEEKSSEIEQPTQETELSNSSGTFDFNSLPGVNDKKTEFAGNKTYTEESSTDYNNAKLDEWLNKETGTNQSGNDAILNEVNELQAKRNDNANTLANQREILEALRARIANNEALCQARKKELEEENLNLTRELNDVLAEINQLTNLANEQEAFLGISNDDETYGKGMAA